MIEHATYMPQDETAAVRAWCQLMKQAGGSSRLHFRSFRVDPADEAAWFGLQERAYTGDVELPETLWETPGLGNNLPDLGEIQADWRAAFKPSDSFNAIAQLSRCLHMGGAYDPSPTVTNLRRDITVTQTAYFDMAEIDAPIAFVADTPWCGFNGDSDWSVTLLLLLPMRRKLKLLLVAGSD